MDNPDYTSRGFSNGRSGTTSPTRVGQVPDDYRGPGNLVENTSTLGPNPLLLGGPSPTPSRTQGETVIGYTGGLPRSTVSDLNRSYERRPNPGCGPSFVPGIPSRVTTTPLGVVETQKTRRLPLTSGEGTGVSQPEDPGRRQTVRT